MAGTLRFELRKAVLETAVITISPRPYVLIILLQPICFFMIGPPNLCHSPFQNYSFTAHGAIKGTLHTILIYLSHGARFSFYNARNISKALIFPPCLTYF